MIELQWVDGQGIELPALDIRSPVGATARLVLSETPYGPALPPARTWDTTVTASGLSKRHKIHADDLHYLEPYKGRVLYLSARRGKEVLGSVPVRLGSAPAQVVRPMVLPRVELVFGPADIERLLDLGSLLRRVPAWPLPRGVATVAVVYNAQSHALSKGLTWPVGITDGKVAADPLFVTVSRDVVLQAIPSGRLTGALRVEWGGATIAHAPLSIGMVGY